MPERILVTGGTGQLGRVVVERLVAAGRPVRALSRRPRSGSGAEWVVGDLNTGRGLDVAVAGVGVIVHCATDYRHEAEVMRKLVEAGRWGGQAPHLVYVSIVGVDRIPLGYYRAKLSAEQLLAGSGLPHTILRATQFHALVRTLLAAAARLPVVPVPRFRFQPVDVRDVATRLAELAVAGPQGRVADFGGPEARSTTELALAVLAASGRTRRVVPVRLPGRLFRAYAEGSNLAPDHADGLVTFEQYLAERGNVTALRYR